MQRFVPDTNLMVAALQHDHVHHGQALRELERRLDSGDIMVVTAHSLAEAYSVLTRIPISNRLPSSLAWALLESVFLGPGVEVAALAPDEYLSALRMCAATGTIGGQVYDAVILACAITARADVLLTFNERHFRSLAPTSIEIVVPGQ